MHPNLCTSVTMFMYVLRRELNRAWMDSAPCSPIIPSPHCHFLIHGTTFLQQFHYQFQRYHLAFQKMSYCMLLNVRLSLLLVDIHMHIPSMQSQCSVLPLFILQLCSTWLIITVGYSRSHSTCACLPVGEG